MSISISNATDADRKAWEQFCQEMPLEHHAHQWVWRDVISKTFGHKPYYLIARTTDGISGVLPLFLVRSVLFGKALISVPYLNGGGVIARDNTTRQDLVAYAEELGQSLGTKYIELRERTSRSQPPTWRERSHKVSMLLPLQSDPQPLFESFPAKLRSQIRRPAKDGLHAESNLSTTYNSAQLDAFYHVFAKNMRDLGTPVYPKKLFETLMRSAGSAARVIVVWSGSEPVAAGITIKNGSTTEIPWASALRKFNRSSPNMLLYWEAIKHASLDGARTFDFGRCTPDSGSFRFKAQWGAIPLPLHWFYHMFQGDLPDVNPKSSKFSTLVECWKHLPLPVANSLGPWLTRSLP